MGIRHKVEEKLLNNYEKYYRLAYSYVKNESDAQDIVQESAYKAMKSCHLIKEESYISTWIYRIVVNTSLDLIRRNKKELLHLAKERLSYENSSSKNITIENSSNNNYSDKKLSSRNYSYESFSYETNYGDPDILSVLDELKDEDKMIVILRYFEDQKLEDIAEITGDNLNTVKTRLYRSLKKLKSLMENDSQLKIRKV